MKLQRGKGGSKETSQETIAIIYERDGATDQGGSSGSNEAELDYGYIFKVKPTRFPKGLNVAGRREKSCLSNRKAWIPLTEMGDLRWSKFEVDSRR